MKKPTKKPIILIFLLLLVVSTILAIYCYSLKQKRNPQTKPDEFSSNRTLSEDDTAVQINFSQCIPDTRRFDLALGSAIIKIVGHDEDTCQMYYGGEIENPQWDGKLNNLCKVAMTEGVVKLNKTPTGLDFSSIQQYCSQLN